MRGSVLKYELKTAAEYEIGLTGSVVRHKGRTVSQIDL